MAPRKKTEEKASGEEAADLILHYLRKQNRPYSAIDVSANLHNKVSKAAAAKILKDLHEQRAIEGRASGKSIVYHACQSSADALGPDELAALDDGTATYRAKTAELVGVAKGLRAQLAALEGEMATCVLVGEVGRLEGEVQGLRERVESLRGGGGRKVGKEERDEVERGWKVAVGAKGARERIAKEVWRVIEDVVGDVEARAELRERLGLDE